MHRYDGFAGQQAERSRSLGELFTAGGGTPAAGAAAAVPTEAMPASTNTAVVQEQAKQLGKARTFTEQQGRALGELRSFGDVLGQRSLEQRRDAGEVDMLSGFKRSSSAVVPFELENANHTADGTKTMADILGAAGRIGMTAGLSPKLAPDAPPVLPTMAQGGVGPDLPLSIATPKTAAPLSLGSMFGPLPSFASGRSPYRTF